MVNYKDINISLLGHDAIQLNHKGLVIYIDPFRLESEIHDVDYVLISHEHFDHCSPEDIKKIIKNSTIIIASKQCESLLEQFNNKKLFFNPFDMHDFGDVQISAVPAYNVNKYRDPEKKIVFHPKEDNKLGFLITINGTTIYFAGDTDLIPELNNIICDVALLPVSGTYVMTAEEAAKAAKILKPKLTIPMHYGVIVGSEEDAIKFQELADNEY